MKLRRFATIGLVIALSAALPVQGHAASGRHCVSRLEPIGRHGVVSAARLVEVGCFPTFAEALAAGSRGAIDVPASMTPASITQADLDVDPDIAVPLSSVMIGTEYNLVAYDGGSNSYFAPSTCSASNTWEVSYVTDAWNDYFSSGKGFGGCDTNKKFAASNFGGSVLTCTPNCSNYGSLSNEVSSLRWKP